MPSIVKSFKILWEKGEVIQGEAEIFNSFYMADEMYDVILLMNGDCIANLSLYPLDSEKEVDMSDKEEESLIEEFKKLL